MAWCRIHLTEDERRIVNEERASHPNLLVRNKMLTIWLLHCGVTRQKAAKLPSARQLVRRLRYQAALRIGSGNARSGSTRSRRQASSSPLRRAASSTAKASTP